MTPSNPWPVFTKVVFRFFFVYFILYTCPFPFGWFMFTEGIGEFYTDIWLAPINWTGRNILNLDYDVTIKPAGSGDTTYNYVQIFIFAVFAFVVTAVWSVLDRHRENYNRLSYWFTIYLRYCLAVVMLTYGFSKVIPLQFGPPSLDRLAQPLGEMSPMGLLWTFMGYSTPYMVFAGIGEVAGGMLLFFKRTRVLGCLIVIAIMSNVAMLNFSYDVPVKLFSMHLLGIAFFLIAPDVKRLLQFFVFNQATQPVRIEPVYATRDGKIAYFTGKSVFVLAFTLLPLYQSVEMYRKYRSPGGNPPLYGIYDVETFVWAGDTLRQSSRDTRGWTKLMIDRRGSATIRYMDGVNVLWECETDTSQHTIRLSAQNSSNPSDFMYRQEGENMVLDGSLNGQQINAVLKKRNFLLVNRGFHWINEYPFNQ